MQIKGQTAIEFLSTYSFTFLIIAVVLFLLLLFSALPKTTLPTQCTFYSGFSCTDTAYYNLGTGSQLVVLASNIEPGLVNVSNFSATIDYAQSTSGYCTPSASSAGQSIYCVANFSTPETLGYTYSITFKMSANYCANAPASIDNQTCRSSATYSYAGQARTEGTTYAANNLPIHSPVQNMFCVGSAAGSTHVYYAAASGGSIGTWTSTNSYPITMANAGCSIYNNYIYCVGSSTGSKEQTYYAPVTSNSVGKWTSTTSYPIAFNNAGCSAYNGYIYCVGSPTGAQSYYAALSSNGIGKWTSTTSYPIQLTDAGCSIYKGYIYCVGSLVGAENQAYYAQVTANGIGTWKSTTTFPTQFSNAGCTADAGYIYCIGAESGLASPIYYAPISSAGIGNWISSGNYPIQITTAGCSILGSNIYCVGSTVGSETQVYYAPILNPGVGTWTASNNYPVTMNGAYCAVSGFSGGYYSGGGGTI
jgi:hypothetical protein